MRGSDFAELRAFAAIVEHGGFARAAAFGDVRFGAQPNAAQPGGTSGCAFTESYHSQRGAD